MAKAFNTCTTVNVNISSEVNNHSEVNLSSQINSSAQVKSFFLKSTPIPQRQHLFQTPPLITFWYHLVSRKHSFLSQHFFFQHLFAAPRLSIRRKPTVIQNACTHQLINRKPPLASAPAVPRKALRLPSQDGTAYKGFRIFKSKSRPARKSQGQDLALTVYLCQIRSTAVSERFTSVLPWDQKSWCGQLITR